MSQRFFKVWYRDSTEPEKANVSAFDAEEAAESYCESCYDSDSAGTDKVSVRDDQGVLEQFDVTIDFDITFSAHPVETEEPEKS